MMKKKSKMNIDEAIELLKKEIENPNVGLPEKIFEFASSILPIVSTELLIKDENNRTLLTWRVNKCSGNGWHIPGGLLRFKETLKQRIEKTSWGEVGALVTYDPTPIRIEQVIDKNQDTRGHAICFLYKCFLPSDFIPYNGVKKEHDEGYVKWFDKCPEDLLSWHEIYRRYIL